MPAAVPMFAIPGSDQLAAFAVKCLAVAGGFLAGYVIGGTAAWALDKWVFAKKSPDFVKKGIRVVAGIALAVLIALIVFGEGGGGLFGGGDGSGPGEGKGTPSNPDDGKKTEQKAQPKAPEYKSPPQADGAKNLDGQYEIVRVTFLGGDAVKDNRFYKLDDSDPMALDQLESALKQRRQTATRPLLLYKEFPDDPRQRISRDSANVRVVERFAEKLGIKVP